MAARSPIGLARARRPRSAKMSPPSSMRKPGTSTSSASALISLAGVLERLVGPVGEVDLGVRDLAALGDLAGALAASTGSRPRRRRRPCSTCGEEALHRLLAPRGRRRPASALNTIWPAGRAVAEARPLEQVERLLALRARELELGVERAADAAASANVPNSSTIHATRTDAGGGTWSGRVAGAWVCRAGGEWSFVKIKMLDRQVTVTRVTDEGAKGAQ